MSVTQLRVELSKLSPDEKLALADYLVREAEGASTATPAQFAELDRRYAEALSRPDTLISPEEAERRIRR